MSDSTWPHGLQHTRLPCPSPSPGVCPSSCPLNQWCSPTISSSVALFSCLQSFQHQCLFQWISCSHQVAKVLELQLQHQSFQSIQGWFPLRLTGLIYLLSKGLSGVFSNITVRKHQFFGTQPSLLSNSHICTEKAMAPHSSSLAWKIPWTEDPGRLQSMGLLKVGHEWATSLSLFTFTFHFHALEKEMATHSSILAWRIPGSGEPGGLMSMGSHRGGHDWSDLAAAAVDLLNIIFPLLFSLVYFMRLKTLS